MPGAGTHTTIIQRPGKLAKEDPDAPAFLTDPDLTANWASHDSAGALQSRPAILGAMGPDVFCVRLDYGDPERNSENIILKPAGTFRATGTLTSGINSIIDRTLGTLTGGIWDDIQQVFAEAARQGVLVHISDLFTGPWTSLFDAVNNRHVARNDDIMDPVIF